MGEVERKPTVTESQVLKLYNETLIGRPTIRRAYMGLPVKPVTRLRLENAAAKLGFAAPPSGVR